jgi:hypothetical protein
MKLRWVQRSRLIARLLIDLSSVKHLAPIVAVIALAGLGAGEILSQGSYRPEARLVLERILNFCWWACRAALGGPRSRTFIGHGSIRRA